MSRKLDKLTFKQAEIEGKSCALYVRVSADEISTQADGSKAERASVQTQRQDLIQYAADRGWSYILYDGDSDQSGFTDDTERADLQRMLEDIRAGKIHTVVVRELKRLSRNTHLTSRIVHEELYPRGCNLVALTESLDIASAEGLMMLGIKSSIAQQELQYISEKSQRSKKLMREAGTLITKPAYGYGIKVIDGIRSVYIKDTEADLVRELFARYSEGEGLQAITNDWQTRGIKCKANGIPRPSLLSKWLRNKIYLGIRDFEGQEYQSPYPAIIDHNLFDKCRTRAAHCLTGVGKHVNNLHLLTGGLLRCGYCQDARDAQTDTDNPYSPSMIYLRQKNNGKEYSRYYCQTSHQYGTRHCTEGISVQAQEIEGRIRDTIGLLIASSYAAQHVERDAHTQQLLAEITEAKGKLDTVKSRKSKIERMFAVGDIEDNEFDNMHSAIKSKVVEVERLIADRERSLSALSTSDTEAGLTALGTWDSLTDMQRREALQQVINRILLYSDRCEIYTHLQPTEPILLRVLRGKGNKVTLRFEESSLKGIRGLIEDQVARGEASIAMSWIEYQDGTVGVEINRD